MLKDLFNDVLPDVYIHRITLQTSQGSIVSSALPGLSKFGGSLAVPSIKINTGEHLKITLDLQINETLDQKNKGKILDKEQFTKYFKFSVIQVMSKEIQNQLIQRNTQTIENILFGKNQEVQQKIFQIPHDILGNPMDFSSNDFVDTIDGKREITIPFRHSFAIPGEPENLSYVILSYLDLDAIARDFGFSVDTIPMAVKEKNRKLLLEQVFENGDVVSKTYAFLQENNTPWTGEVKQKEDGSFVGIDKTGKEITISRLVLNNNKIQDFRKTDRSKKFTPDLTKINNLVSNEKLEKHHLKNKINEKKSYFSPLCISYNRLENVKGLFIFDVKKYLLNNSRFSGLFDKDKLLDEAIRRTSIKSIKVFRQRIEGSAEAGSKPRMNKFDENEVPELIAYSGETNGVLLDSSSNTGDITEISGIYLQNGNFGKRCFSFTDKSIRQITDGFFTYSVQIELFDGSVDLLREKVREISTGIQNLTEYQNAADGVMTVGLVETQIQQTLRNVNTFLPQSGKKSSWNASTNTFVRPFTETVLRKYNKTEETPWFKGITLYENYLLEFTSATFFEISELSKELMKMASPKTGTPGGIRLLVDLLKTASLSIEKHIKNTSVLGSSGNEVKKSVAGVKQDRDTLKIEKVFPEVVNTSRILDTGVDYLDIRPTEENIGIKKVNLNEYFQRVKREYNTIFNLQNDVPIDISIKYGNNIYTESDHLDRTGYSFLGPSYVVKQGKIILSRVGNSPSPLNSGLSFASFGVSANIQQSNQVTTQQINDMIVHSTELPPQDRTSTNFLGSPIIKSIEPNNDDTQQSGISDSLVSHFSSIGVSIGSNPNISVDKFDVSIRRGENLKSDRVSSKIDLPVYAFAPNLQYPPKEDFTRILMFLLGDDKKTTQITKYNLDTADNYLNYLMSNIKKLDKQAWWPDLDSQSSFSEMLKTLPNQTKSLFLESAHPDIVKRKWVARSGENIMKNIETATEFDFYQNNIQAIEVLSDFTETDQGEKEIASPVWKPLTPELLDNNRDRHFICRMRQYENDIVGVLPKYKNENVFDECFVILPTQGFSRGGFGSPFVPIDNTRKVASSPFVPGQNLVDRGLISTVGTGQSKVQEEVFSNRGQDYSIGAVNTGAQDAKKALSVMKVQQEQEQKNVSTVFTTTNATGLFINKKI